MIKKLNSLQNSTLVVQSGYSSEFSIGKNTLETSLLISYVTVLLYLTVSPINTPKRFGRSITYKTWEIVGPGQNELLI